MTAQKNILFIHHVSCLAGAEKYLISVIENLDKKFKCFFICQEPGPLATALENLGVTTHFMKLRAWRKFKNFLANTATVKTLVQYCRENDIHLICSNSYRVTPYAVSAAKKLGIPSVSVIHDFVDNDKLKKFFVFKSSLVIGVSESVCCHIRKDFSGNITHVYNGIDAEKFGSDFSRDDPFRTDAFREEFKISKETKILGMVANFIPLKGHKVFLEAAKIAMQRFEDTVCVIVGDSPDANQLSLKDLQDFADMIGIPDKVIFTGQREDVASIISSFDVLVHPANREAFGRVIIEAMALGVPVVATRSGGPEEIMQHRESGLLAPVNNSKEIAKHIMSLLIDEGRRISFGLKGQERVKQIFTLDKTVKKFNELFDTCLILKKHERP